MTKYLNVWYPKYGRGWKFFDTEQEAAKIAKEFGEGRYVLIALPVSVEPQTSGGYRI